MSVHPISYSDDFLPGQTLNSNLEPAQPPFDVNSLPELFDQDQFKKLPLTTVGEQQELFQLVMNAQDKVTSLGVGGSLDLTCGPVTGNANVKFAMDNINSGLSLSVVYRVSRTGESQRVDLYDLNKIKLSEAVLTQIKGGKLSFDQFTAAYGKYVIIGFESGGEILYDSTYSTKSSQDKMSVSGGLSLAYNKIPGFSVSGRVDGDYKQADINKSLNVKTTYLISPPSNSKDQQKLLEYLNDLTNITQNADPTKLSSLKNDIDQTANAILNPTKDSNNPSDSNGPSLDWSKTIIYPIESIPCVSDAFTQTAIIKHSISGFLQYLNKLYINISSKVQDMNAMSDKWPNSSKSTFQDYAVKFTRIIQLIQTLSDDTILSNYGNKYNTFIQGGDDDTKQENKENDTDNNKKQIDIATNEFYKISITMLDWEYDADIFTPFNDYISKSELTASLSVACDDYVKVNLSQNSGGSYSTISDDHWGWKSAKTINNIAVSANTVLQFVCTNAGDNPAGFIGLIKLSNGKQYMTPDVQFKCTTSTPNLSNGERIQMIRFDKNAWGGIDKVFPDNASFIWPNNNNKKETHTFEFKFSDVISA